MARPAGQDGSAAGSPAKNFGNFAWSNAQAPRRRHHGGGSNRVRPHENVCFLGRRPMFDGLPTCRRFFCALAQAQSRWHIGTRTAVRSITCRKWWWYHHSSVIADASVRVCDRFCWWPVVFFLFTVRMLLTGWKQLETIGIGSVSLKRIFDCNVYHLNYSIFDVNTIKRILEKTKICI